MSPVPEDDIKDPTHDDVDTVENMEFPEVILPLGTSDSDDDDGGEDLGSYQLLPQDPNDATVGLDDSLSNDEETENEHTWRISEPADSQQPHLSQYSDGTAPAYLQVQDLPRPDKKDLLWNQSNKASDSIIMDDEHAAEIKAAMAGFQLPVSHVPEWAKNVSDDQWKDKVVSQILSPPLASSTSKDHTSSCSTSKNHTSSCG
ncbi:hypothetical protein SNE40_009533 [Patella caerulea]|uniref:Male-enhanced antigen 1 n=1 Tax=Patella caerulea TaxID=87958 RepID=A0AAN8PRQ5_PATCE